MKHPKLKDFFRIVYLLSSASSWDASRGRNLGGDRDGVLGLR